MTEWYKALGTDVYARGIASKLQLSVYIKKKLCGDRVTIGLEW